MVKIGYAILVGVLFAGVTSGQSIHVAFHIGTDTENAMAAAVAPTAYGDAVQAGDSWNAVRSGGTGTGVSGLSFTQNDLNLSDGTVSSASITGNAGYSGGNSLSWSAENKDWAMMEGWFGLKQVEALTVSNLPASLTSGGYHVIVYADSNDSNRTMRYVLGGQEEILQDSGSFGGTFAEGVNRAVFTNLTATSFTLTGNPGSGDARSAVSGLCIVAGAPLSIQSFAADDGYVAPGTPIKLQWNVPGADGIAIAPGVGDVSGLTTNGVGEVVVNPFATTTYTLTASNATTTVQQTVRVGVGPPRPNILFFLVDDMGWQDTSEPFHYDTNGVEVVTVLNQRYRTPNMEIFADRSMKFTRAYALPVCTPTRSTLQTGMNSARHHITNWTNPTGGETGTNGSTGLTSPSNWRKRGLDATDQTLAQHLQAAGYRTIHSGKAHFGSRPYFGSDPHNIGFDINIAGNEIGHPGSYQGNYGQGGSRPVPGLSAYHNTGTFLTDAITLEMQAAMSESVSNGVPFFGWMAHYAVHSPFNIDQRFTNNYPTLSGGPLGYATLLEGMDKSLGDLLAHLDTLGIAEDTFVVFLSDNGGDAPISNGNAPLRGKKGHRHEGGVRVPMMAGWARQGDGSGFQADLPVTPGTREADLVFAADLMPTVLDVARVDLLHMVDGYSLIPYFKGETGAHRPQKLAMHFPHGHNNKFYSMMYDGPLKFIYNYANQAAELYDLDADIGETTNLVGIRTNEAVRLRRALIRTLDDMGAQFPELNGGGAVSLPMVPVAGLDLDDDGIADDSEDTNNNGLVDPGETDPDDDDTDGDNTPDGAERRLGTDPLDIYSTFQAEPERDGLGWSIRWPSQPGASFRVEGASSPEGPWNALEDNVTATNPGEATSLPVNPASNRVFRVELK